MGTALRREQRRDARRRLFPFLQSRQALDRGRFRHRRGARDRPPSRQPRGRPDREFPRPRPPQIPARLSGPAGDQSAPRLLLDDRLRPDRTLCRAPRLRFPHPGDGRDHGPHRRSGRASRRRSASPSPTSSPGSTRSSPSRQRCAAPSRPGAASGSTWRSSTSRSGCSANQALNYLVSGASPARLGNAHMNIAPYEVLPANDGHTLMAVGNDGQFRNLVGPRRSRMPAIPISPTTRPRRQSRAASSPAFGAGREDPARRPSQAARAAGFRRARSTRRRSFADPQIIDRGMRFNLPRPGGHNVPPSHADVDVRDAPRLCRASPRLGEHTSDVLAEIGYAPEAVTELMSTRGRRGEFSPVLAAIGRAHRSSMRRPSGALDNMRFTASRPACSSGPSPYSPARHCQDRPQLRFAGALLQGSE